MQTYWRQGVKAIPQMRYIQKKAPTQNVEALISIIVSSITPLSQSYSLQIHLPCNISFRQGFGL